MTEQRHGQAAVPPPSPSRTVADAEPHLPSPTVWPAIAASGITLMLWGLITSFVVTGAGVVLFIIALVGWGQQILTEAHDHAGEEG